PPTPPPLFPYTTLFRSPSTSPETDDEPPVRERAAAAWVLDARRPPTRRRPSRVPGRRRRPPRAGRRRADQQRLRCCQGRECVVRSEEHTSELQSRFDLV